VAGSARISLRMIGSWATAPPTISISNIAEAIAGRHFMERFFMLESVPGRSQAPAGSHTSLCGRTGMDFLPETDQT
jgi:hypothetical protein